MRKYIWAMAAAVALALTMLSPAVADSHAEILSPTPDEVVFENMLELEAVDYSAPDNEAHWAVREGTCEVNGEAVRAGNYANGDDPYDWADGAFSATVDITGWDAGGYCFAFNTTVGDAEGHRLTQWFYIVDEYAKVGGAIGVGELGKGNSPTHTFDGVVGNAGSYGTVGSITVNYRELEETIVYEADSISLQAASGVTGNSEIAKAVIYATDGTQIQVLDRDATPSFPRGAIIVRPADADYQIGGSSGADSWVAMERGNNHVGIR